MNETINLINNRMSLRKYSKDNVIKDEELNIILHAAMRAPTAGNMMLYSILIIKDKRTKKKLAKTCDNQPFIENSDTILLFLGDLSRWYDYYNECKVKEFCNENEIIFREPDEGELFLSMQDAIIAAQTASICAESLGIGSCYIGDIIENYEIHKEMFNLKKYVYPACMLCMGHYEEGKERILTDRFKKEYIVFNEKYRELSKDELKDMFKEKENKVSKKNVYGASNFGQFNYARKTGGDFSIEMGRSARQILKNFNGRDL
ncbi:nitroreductase family protein [Clostridium sp.]|uniref:nitroreductase family protein n=1 Tax=Clostridium sp. TaxID=1506 RepID=UPI002FC79AF7